MICFPNAKINIGLEIVRKRTDNFHDIETIFYPVSLCDILELNPSDETTLSLSGLNIEGNQENNLVIKAYNLLKETYNLPPVAFHLHKQIPSGAGLGGGSSNAAFTLTGLNQLFQLNIKKNSLVELASQLGSDCAFFVQNQPVFAEGKGDVFSAIPLNLSGFSLVLIKPPFGVSTAEAYAGIVPSLPGLQLKESIKKPVAEWKDFIFNRFEENVFRKHPEIKAIKETLYGQGALYASMSGSGSTVYGIFKDPLPYFKALFPNYFIWEEKFQ